MRPGAFWFIAGTFFAIRLGPAGAQEPASPPAHRTSPRFSGPVREPPDRDADALHLRLEVAFDWEKREVAGKAAHTFRALKDLRALTLDAVNLQVLKVTGGGGEELRFESRPESLRIDLGRDLPRGEEFRFTIDYRARPERGVYFVEPDAAYPKAPKQVWTQGEPIENRHWIPCFDHPVDKLTAEVLVTAPEGMIGLSNGRLVGDPAPAPGGGRVFHWSQDKPLATYLIACVVGTFAEYRGEWKGVPLVAYVPPGEAANAERSFKLTGDMCQFFFEKTGVPYPWAKYGQVCVSDFPMGGMENTSLTVLTERTLHGAADEEDVDSVGLVSHELSHQWFGDLVTCRDWSDIWLNESFATFFENLYTEKLRGRDQGIYERMQEADRYKAEDGAEYRRPIETHRYLDPEVVFDAHSYPKGARVLTMLRYVLGDERFFAGIRRYLKERAYGTAETSDLRQALEEESGSSLRWFFDEWIQRGGHPEYKVDALWDERSGVLRVEVLQTQRVDSLTPLFRMPVEIEVAAPSGRRVHRVEVAAAKETFSFTVPERPRAVLFDPRDWILKDIEFPRPREELLYLVVSEVEVPGRIAAARGLGRYADEEVRGVLLARLSADPFWGVRVEVAKVLRGFGGDAVREGLIRACRSEKRSAVRREIVQALSGYPGADTVEFLRQTIAGDPSSYVAGDALRSLARIDPRAALAEGSRALERDSYQEEIRCAAIDAIGQNDSLEGKDREEAIDRLIEWHRRGRPIPVRATAGRALAKVGRGVERAYQALAGSVDDPSIEVRLSAFMDLLEFGDRRAIEVLRKRREKESRRVIHDPLDRIDKAVKGLSEVGERDQILKELRRLREGEERLEGRVKALEERRGAGAARKY